MVKVIWQLQKNMGINESRLLGEAYPWIKLCDRKFLVIVAVFVIVLIIIIIYIYWIAHIAVSEKIKPGLILHSRL